MMKALTKFTATLVLWVCVIGIGAFRSSAAWASSDDEVLYGQARAAHLAGRFEAALAMYADIEGDPYVEAARLYQADCLVRLQRHQDATAAYRKYLGESRYVIYRGEAMLELARLLCTLGKDHYAEADQLLVEALDWHGTMTSEETSPDPEALHPLLLSSNSLLNPRTSRWYLPVLRSKTLLLRAYTAVQIGTEQDVHEAMGGIVEMDAEASGLSPIVLRSIERDVFRRSFAVPGEVWTAMTDEHRAALQLALFYCSTYEHDLAIPILTTVLADTSEGAGHASDWAAAVLGLAIIDIQEGRSSDAINRLDLFEGLLRGTTAARFGRLLLANVLAANPKTYMRALRIYGELAEEDGAAPRPAEALLVMLQAAANKGDYGTCYRANDQIQQRHPQSPQAKFARVLLAAITPSQQKSTAETPRVRPVATDEPRVETIVVRAQDIIQAKAVGIADLPHGFLRLRSGQAWIGPDLTITPGRAVIPADQPQGRPSERDVFVRVDQIPHTRE